MAVGLYNVIFQTEGLFFCFFLIVWIHSNSLRRFIHLNTEASDDLLNFYCKVNKNINIQYDSVTNEILNTIYFFFIVGE
jgi:hypothetical protein